MQKFWAKDLANLAGKNLNSSKFFIIIVVKSTFYEATTDFMIAESFYSVKYSTVD